MINEIDLLLSEFKIEYRSPPNHPMPQCYKCKHYLGQGECLAFKEIPDDIFYGEHDHRKPYPGDNGIRFEPIEK